MWDRTEKGRTLVWHGKHGDEYWNADTPERFKASFLAMFSTLDANDMYCNLGEPGYETGELIKLKKRTALLSSAPDLIEKKDLQTIARLEHNLKKDSIDLKLYNQARNGNWNAAFTLLSNRNDYEYEGWEYLYIVDPLVK